MSVADGSEGAAPELMAYVCNQPDAIVTFVVNTYGAEIQNVRKERPDIRVVVYDHSFEGDRSAAQS